MHKDVSISQMAQMMLFHFTNNSAEILLHILGYIFCDEYHILVIFVKFCCHKKQQKVSSQMLLCFRGKHVGIIDPLTHFSFPFEFLLLC
jgi:hypothetical protein